MKKNILPSFAIAHFLNFLEYCALSISLVLILHCTLWAKSGRTSSWMRFYTLLSLVCNIRLKVFFCIKAAILYYEVEQLIQCPNKHNEIKGLFVVSD